MRRTTQSISDSQWWLSRTLNSRSVNDFCNRSISGAYFTYEDELISMGKQFIADAEFDFFQQRLPRQTIPLHQITYHREIWLRANTNRLLERNKCESCVRPLMNMFASSKRHERNSRICHDSWEPTFRKSSQYHFIGRNMHKISLCVIFEYLNLSETHHDVAMVRYLFIYLCAAVRKQALWIP